MNGASYFLSYGIESGGLRHEIPVTDDENTKPEKYDLMEVVILNLGDADTESSPEILKLLNVLFSPSMPLAEKKRRLNELFHKFC